ncbi:MAG: hypothetical protein P8Z49_05435 [Acidobacteriota bacterium]
MARQDPHSYFDSDQPLTKDLDWKINVNFKEKRLEGVMTLHLAEPSAGAFDLDTRDLRIEGIEKQFSTMSQVEFRQGATYTAVTPSHTRLRPGANGCVSITSRPRGA